MKSSILLSIHNAHSDSIINGKKQFEYRRVVPVNEIHTIVLYCTAPTRRISALVEVDGIISGSPTYVWKKTSNASGITREQFRHYFQGRKIANAFKLGKVLPINTFLSLSDINLSNSGPQSFVYLSESVLLRIHGEAKLPV